MDSPWPGVARASFPLTGKYYLLMCFGHLCYLLPDTAVRQFMRRTIAPMIGIAGAVMLTCLVMSPITSTMPADHLYLVRPDTWLTVYWVAFLGTLFVLELISLFGGNRLRSDPRSVMVKLLMGSQAVGSLAIVLIGFGVVSGRTEIPRFLVWPFAYAGIVGGAIFAVISWRHRKAGMFTPIQDSRGRTTLP